MNGNLNIKALLSKMSRKFGILKEAIKIENGVGDFSLNLISETTVMKIYSVSKDLDFKNANLFERNFPGIDGIDEVNRMIVQVTSTFSTEKIENTIDAIISRSLYEKYPHLIFIFLGDKKKLSKSFRAGIERKIEGKIKFNFDTDLIDLKDIYGIHQYSQDIEKIHKVVNILEETYESTSSMSGFDALSVCFHDEELNNVFFLVDALIKQGMNVYISSKKLNDKFISENHPLKDFIIYAPQFRTLDHIDYSIVVLSNSLIYQIINSTYTCPLFTYAINNDITIDVMSFDSSSLKDLKKTDNPKIKNFRSVTLQNVSVVVKKILEDRLKKNAFINISRDEVLQELINAHSSFKPYVVYNDSAFTLLNLKMPDQEDVELNYIILGPKANLTSVNTKIKSLRKDLKSLNILVSKDFEQKTRRRIDTVKTTFNTERVYYLDEHLYDKKFMNLQKHTILNIDEFVAPVIKLNEEHLGINDIVHWIFNNSDSTIAIITGSGGIGKTTVCEKIHDIIIEEYDRNIVIFIDASQYLEVFRRRGNSSETEYDLYNIFSESHPHAKFIDKNSFYLNLSLGNLIIIFDGIDEIISTIPSFNLYKFCETIENLRRGIGKGKILINCRDNYVTDLKKIYGADINYLQIYDLLGFSEELARIFFLKFFKNEDQVRSCMKLIKEFYPDDDDVIYKHPPFILEIVKQIVESGFEYEEINTDFDSRLLQPNENNDIVVFRICNREIVKKERLGFQLAIDEQVRFLCEMAIEEKGKIDQADFTKILENIGIKDRVEDVVKGLLDHPLIYKKNGFYNFRFDFFNIYFKSITIFNLLCADVSIKITDRIINTLAFECNYNSFLSKTLIQKAKSCKLSFENCLKFSKIAIKAIDNFQDDENVSMANRKRKAISNVLLIIFSSKTRNHSFESIIENLFGTTANVIESFYFIDVPDFAKISLDFSNYYFTKAEINNYGSFFNCNFNSDTFFDETCYISNVYSTKVNLKNIKAKIENFDKKIKGDNSIFRVMSIKNNENEVSRYFREYLNSFFVGKQFQTELADKSISFLSDDIVTFDLLTNTLMNQGIILNREDGKVFLDVQLKGKILRFLTSGITFTQLNHAVSELKKIMLLRVSGQQDNCE